MTIDDMRNASVQRACLHYLYSLGMPESEPRADVWVLGPELMMDRTRKLQAWVAESVLYAFREMARQRADWRVVMRCWGQARAYLSELDATPSVGVPHAIRDAITTLQNELESRLRA